VPAIGVREQFRHLLQNDQALILFAAQAVVMVMNTLKFGAAAYFVKYVLQMPATFLSLMLTAASVAGIVAPLVTGYLLRRGRIKRIPLLVYSQLASAVITLAMGFTPASAVWPHLWLFVSATLMAELIAVILWASVADVADYGFYRFGVRINGMIGGGMLFSTKAGMAVGGALVGYILAWFGYQPDNATAALPEQLPAFRVLYIWLPACCLFLTAGILRFYRLDEQKTRDVMMRAQDETGRAEAKRHGL
jgi:GPH family glycoside/pentoside/hexuronide:cation symporter